MLYALQLFNDDCAFTSLKNLMANVSKDYRYLNIPNPKVKGSYNFLEIINIASKYGFILKGYKVNDFSLLPHNKCFISEINNNGRSHAVMIYKITSSKIFLIDPSIGKLSLYKEEFCKKFTGNILLIEGSHPVKLSNQNKGLSIFKSIYSFTLLIINSLVIISLYLINRINISFNIGNILIIILLLLSNRIVYLIFDKIFDYYFIEKKINYLNSYDTFTSFYLLKKETLERYASFMNNISILIFISIMTLCNSLYFIIPELLLLLTNILYFKINNNQNSYHLSTLENEIVISPKKKEKYKLMNKTLGKVKAKTLIYETIQYLIIGCSLILMVIGNHIISINYLLFNFFLLYFFSSQISKLLLFFSSYHQFKKNEAIYHTYINKKN